MLAEKRQTIAREDKKRGKKEDWGKKRGRRKGLYMAGGEKKRREKVEGERERVGVSIRKPATAEENASRYYSRTSKVLFFHSWELYLSFPLPHLPLSLFFSRAPEMRFAPPFSGFFTTREIFTLWFPYTRSFSRIRKRSYDAYRSRHRR